MGTDVYGSVSRQTWAEHTRVSGRGTEALRRPQASS